MSYQRITDPGWNTGKVRIGCAASPKPRRLNQDEIEMQSILLGRAPKQSVAVRIADYVLSFIR